MPEIQTLLIVDDCEIDREVFREYLSEDSQANYEIFEATEAGEGLAICREIQCDLILLDFRLPDMTGLEFLQQRQQQTGVPPSVIMMTGEGCETVAVQALQSGADNYLSKNGLEAPILIQAVQDAIRQRRLKAPQETPVLPEAMAAAVLRFRRFLELQPLLEAVVHEIRRLTQCDRVSILKESSTIDASPLSQSQSFQLGETLRQFATAQQRRRRGRPPKYRPAPIDLTPIRWPIQSPGEETEWGWLLLEYLPDSTLMMASEETAFAGLVEQVAIAISHAEHYEQALSQTEQLKRFSKQQSERKNGMLVKARNHLSAVLAASSTLVQHRKRLNTAKQDSILQTLEEHSREFIQILEDMTDP